MVLSSTEMTEGEEITASVRVKNIGLRSGEDVIQLYIRDLAASVVRPVKELKGFRKVFLEAGEEKKIKFVITEKELGFLREDGTWGTEPGKYVLWIGDSSSTENSAKFIIMK